MEMNEEIVAVLQEHLDSIYTPEEQETLQWFVDVDNELYYTWRFALPGGNMQCLVYNRDTEDVEYMTSL